METEHSQLICNYTFYDQLELWGHYGELHKALAVILRGSACRRRPGVRVISPQPHPTLTCLYVSHIHWLIIQSRRSSSMCFTKIGTVGGPRCCKKCQGGTHFCVLLKDGGFIYKSLQIKTNRVIWDFCLHETNLSKTNPQYESLGFGFTNPDSRIRTLKIRKDFRICKSLFLRICFVL